MFSFGCRTLILNCALVIKGLVFNIIAHLYLVSRGK